MENENKELAVTKENGVQTFSSWGSSSNTNVETFSNITDSKKLFNLETKVDCLLNKCVGEKLRVKEVLLKRFFKPLEKPEVDEETGEVIKEYETKVSCILIDDSGKSYATGSKTFAYNLAKLLGNYGGEALLEQGIEMEIIKVPVPNSSNEALSFKLL